jgi:membrane fusion protein, multidrug efflux system
MFARVQMQERSTVTAVLIDDKAVLTDQSRKYVYVVDAAQRAQRRDLQLGRMVDGKRIVESGLAPGEQLVVAGMQRIFYPGMPLAPQRLDSQAAGAALPETQKPAQKAQP